MSEQNILLVEHPEARRKEEHYGYKLNSLAGALYLYGDSLSVARRNESTDNWELRTIEPWGIFLESELYFDEEVDVDVVVTPAVKEKYAVEGKLGFLGLTDVEITDKGFGLGEVELPVEKVKYRVSIPAEKGTVPSLESLQNLYSMIDANGYSPVLDIKMRAAYREFANLRLARLSPEAMKRSQEATLGSVAIMNTVNVRQFHNIEVVGIKTEETANLIRFRKHLRDLVSGQTDNKDSVWSINEAFSVFENQIRLGAEEHSERVAANAYVSNLGAEYLGNPRPWVENIFALILAEAWGVSMRQSLGAIAIMSTSHFIKAGWDKQQLDKELAYNPFHYLTQLANHL